MTNKQAKEYIKKLSLFNKQDYMNGNKENYIGKWQLEYDMFQLKISLRVKKIFKIKYSMFTKHNWKDV